MPTIKCGFRLGCKIAQNIKWFKTVGILRQGIQVECLTHNSAYESSRVIAFFFDLKPN